MAIAFILLVSCFSSAPPSLAHSVANNTARHVARIKKMSCIFHACEVEIAAAPPLPLLSLSHLLTRDVVPISFWLCLLAFHAATYSTSPVYCIWLSARNFGLHLAAAACAAAALGALSCSSASFVLIAGHFVLLCAMIPKMSSTCCCCCCFYHSFSVIFIFIVASAWHTESFALSCCCSKIRCCFKCFLAAYTRYSK